jgi:type I restriction-modification system DNA methylase subunit
METKRKKVVSAIVADTLKVEEKMNNLSVFNENEEQGAQVMNETTFKPNLAETMRIIDDLHTKTRHRNKLEVYSDILAKFKIEHEEEDLVNRNYYNGCLLSIKDDNRDSFELKNPALIREVVEYLMKRFNEKRQEIEAEIILPN